MRDMKIFAEQISQRFLKSQLRRKVRRQSYVISVLKQKLSLMSNEQKRKVVVSDASKRSVHLGDASFEESPTPVNYLFMTHCTSSLCCLVAPEVWLDLSEHGVGYVGDGKWLFHRRVTSPMVTTTNYHQV